MENLIGFYRKVLSFSGLHADDKGFIRTPAEGNPPLMIDGRVMVIPTREQLKSLNEEKEVFHPLSENTLVKMAPSLGAYLYRLNGHLNTVFAQLIIDLKHLALSPAKGMEFMSRPECLEVFKKLAVEPAASKNPDGFLNFVIEQITENPSGAFFQISMGRGGTYKGNKCSRVGYTSFQLYKRLKDDIGLPRKDSEFKKINAEQVKLLVSIYEAVFPGLDNKEEYNFGYTSGPYPFFATCLETAKKLALRINYILELFGDDFASEDLEFLDLSWTEDFEDQNKMVKMSKAVPNLDINDQIYKEGGGETTQPSKPVGFVAPTPTPIKEEAHHTTIQATTVKKADEKKSSAPTMDEWLKKKAVPTAMGAQGTRMELLKRHNEGYAEWFTNFLKNSGGLAPSGFIHPNMLTPGSMAPSYPGSPLANMQPMPQQQVWNQPTQQNIPRDAWGNPIHPSMMQPQMPQGMPPQMQLDAWGRPVQMPQPQVWVQPQMPMQGQVAMVPQGGWGQRPPVDAWGRPLQMPQQNGWGQPQQQVWGQSPMTSPIPGAV